MIYEKGDKVYLTQPTYDPVTYNFMHMRVSWAVVLRPPPKATREWGGECHTTEMMLIRADDSSAAEWCSLDQVTSCHKAPSRLFMQEGSLARILTKACPSHQEEDLHPGEFVTVVKIPGRNSRTVEVLSRLGVGRIDLRYIEIIPLEEK